MAYRVTRGTGSLTSLTGCFLIEHIQLEEWYIIQTLFSFTGQAVWSVQLGWPLFQGCPVDLMKHHGWFTWKKSKIPLKIRRSRVGGKVIHFFSTQLWGGHVKTRVQHGINWKRRQRRERTEGCIHLKKQIFVLKGGMFAPTTLHLTREEENKDSDVQIRSKEPKHLWLIDCSKGIVVCYNTVTQGIFHCLPKMQTELRGSQHVGEVNLAAIFFSDGSKVKDRVPEGTEISSLSGSVVSILTYSKYMLILVNQFILKHALDRVVHGFLLIFMDIAYNIRLNWVNFTCAPFVRE